MSQTITKQEFKESIIKQYETLNYARLRKLILRDLNDNAEQTNIYLKKYKKKDIEGFLLSPDKLVSQKALKDISRFFYAVSPHYRRLVEFFANLPTFNYVVKPCADLSNVNLEAFRTAYLKTCLTYEKYRLKSEAPKILTHLFIDGVFYGITYENKDSFVIKYIPTEYAEIASEENGVYLFNFDLNYFSNSANKKKLSEFGKDFEDAYDKYKGNAEKGIAPNSKARWFEPKNQICIKFDEETPYCIPPFVGLFNCLIELDIYKEIKKDKAMMDNFRLIHFEIPVDSDGVPKMTFEQANQYYDLTASNLPEGVGLSMSPFKADNFTLKNTSSDEDFVEQATRDLFANAGLNPLLFGLGDNPTSSSLDLSTRPDEALVFKLLRQIANVFNLKFLKTNPTYYFEIMFLEQSIFNKDKVSDSYLKAAQYGAPTKIHYASSLGLTPVDITEMSFVENNVLEMTDKIFNNPLISSNTLSNGGKTEDNEGGRPKTDNPSDNTELGEDNNTENR